MFYEGRQIGSYTLLRKLGKGGFGEVWLAEKRSQFVTKRVAVKLPLDEQVNFDAIRQEAELWEQASGHPNVLPIIDADVFDGQVVIVSEYADGGSLADRVKREGKLPLQKAVEITIGILNGLEFLHSRKIIHRDIKPQNILLQGDTPRLADFGISRAMNTTIVSSAIIGTDAYMSPESFDGKRNVQTDIWSVGVVLYALLADRLPFPQEHPSERMFAILTKKFEPLPTDVPQNLQGIVAKSLAKQPENRYQTTSEMRDELQKVLLGIAHPTYAKTEVFRIPIENLPTIPTLENKYETNEPEKETVVSPQNINFPAPTEASFLPESVVTNFKEVPPVTNEPVFSPSQEAQEPQAAQFQMYGKLLPNKPQTSYDSLADVFRKNRGFKYVLFGVVALFFLIGSIIFMGKVIDRPTLSNRAIVSNASTVSNRAPLSNSSTVSSSNTVSMEKMDIIIKAIGVKIAFTADVDKEFRVFTLEPDELKNLFPKESLRLRYYKDVADKVQLIVNGKPIALPTAPADPSLNSIVIKITKDNLTQILQSGKITAIE
jgi:serine/threonine-protein kinase